MNTEKLIQVAKKHLLNVVKKPEIIMSRGEGMYLYDTEGKEYLDFIGGWAVNCLGHSPKVLSDALAEQAKTLINASPAFYNLPLVEYTELLISHCCLDKAFYMSSGAEANEGAIKLARKYGALSKNGASDIITTQFSFHGRTLSTMSATGKDQWEKLFDPKPKGFLKSIFNNIDSVKNLITKDVCAIMIEPIQGEGGVNVATEEYITGLKEICDQENILLIFDEIQTGMGRTGKLFAYEHYGIEPDIMTLGKGIGGGFPLSAMLTSERLDIFEPGDQGGTYTGQPLAMAIGLAVLKELLNKGVIEHCQKMGELMITRLEELASEYEIENIRGKGLLLAFDLKQSNGAEIAGKCLEDGLLINAPKPESIRFIPPLIVNENEIDKMFAILKQHLAKN